MTDDRHGLAQERRFDGVWYIYFAAGDMEKRFSIRMYAPHGPPLGGRIHAVKRYMSQLIAQYAY